MRTKKQSTEAKVKEIRRHTRKKYSAEDKIRIVIDGLSGGQVLQNFVGAKALVPTSITNEVMTFLKMEKID
ncbi:hypothetical protein [Marinifilum caeruleilacunae]|uniref:Transposase n=1 Tax=Marinifilum caeruleilacunae TaxID=2499076 RepID=A0ABX1X219_9BACT|nr:hypothetical protein [Marinifilum caeruleilacunae]NOU62138.1 hypothetical protein [Marinifilum caeruleilacunae]